MARGAPDEPARSTMHFFARQTIGHLHISPCLPRQPGVWSPLIVADALAGMTSSFCEPCAAYLRLHGPAISPDELET